MTMPRLVLTLSMFLLPALVAAQNAPDSALPQSPESLEAQRHFEAGRYQPVIDLAAPASAAPDLVYAAARSYQRLAAAAPADAPGLTDQAARTYDRLAALPERSPWRFIGVSGRRLLENQVESAIAEARQAVAVAQQRASGRGGTADPDLAAAQFQLGLALGVALQWPEAVAAFEAAAEQQPRFAYTYYYGGLAYSRANRPDRMATYFDQFLKLAPDAPERPEVQSLLRTIRRR